MDLTQEIEKISKNIMEVLSTKDVTIDVLDWVLTQAKEKIYASTHIKPMD